MAELIQWWKDGTEQIMSNKWQWVCKCVECGHIYPVLEYNLPEYCCQCGLHLYHHDKSDSWGPYPVKGSTVRVYARKTRSGWIEAKYDYKGRIININQKNKNDKIESVERPKVRPIDAEELCYKIEDMFMNGQLGGSLDLIGRITNIIEGMPTLGENYEEQNDKRKGI